MTQRTEMRTGDMEKICDYCYRTGDKLKRCSMCRFVFYCSQDCQAKHWTTHKLSCKDKKPNTTDDTNASTNDICAYCKKEKYNLKRCSTCRKVSYCSVACQEKSWPDHKLDCIKVKEKTKFDLSRKCDYCGNAILVLGRIYDCEGCSNIYCTQYCQAYDWLNHKKVCNLQTTAKQTSSNQFNKCEKCNSIGDLKFCSRCHAAAYCSKPCQKADWKKHKNVCRDPENSNSDRIIETKIEIELKLKEIMSRKNKSFHKRMSSPGCMTFPKGDTSALFYDDFVDLRIYKTPKNGSWDKAIPFTRKTYPDYLVLLEMNKVPDEGTAVATKQLLVAYIPRYHNYRGKHCVYIEDVRKVELYIAFYFDNQLSRTFDWSEVKPGRFIIIFNPKIRHFDDTSVGFRLEGTESFKFLDI